MEDVLILSLVVCLDVIIFLLMAICYLLYLVLSKDAPTDKEDTPFDQFMEHMMIQMKSSRDTSSTMDTERAYDVVLAELRVQRDLIDDEIAKFERGRAAISCISSPRCGY